jgi:hypothetical protein
VGDKVKENDLDVSTSIAGITGLYHHALLGFANMFRSC